MAAMIDPGRELLPCPPPPCCSLIISIGSLQLLKKKSFLERIWRKRVQKGYAVCLRTFYVCLLADRDVAHLEGEPNVVGSHQFSLSVHRNQSHVDD